MHISDIQFWDIKGSTALCIFVTDDGVVSLQCNSQLADGATDIQHRTAWVKDALRQQRRMPEFRNCTNNIEICPTALSFIGITEL